MPIDIDFRSCVHQGIAGPTPGHILATIRAEYCLPRAELPAPRNGAAEPAAAIQLEDFTALARALGPAAFRQLTADVLRRRDPRGTLAELPDFLASHRYGRATPALGDLARLDLAVATATRAPQAQSIGACCLPPDLLRAHPDLALEFHPAWRWLALACPADKWRETLLTSETAVEAPVARRTWLRAFPQRGRIVLRNLTQPEFVFETTLRDGATFRQASDRANDAVTASQSAPFDGVLHLQSLLMAGAVAGVRLHPQGEAPKPAPTTTTSAPNDPQQR